MKLYLMEVSPDLYELTVKITNLYALSSSRPRNIQRNGVGANTGLLSRHHLPFLVPRICLHTSPSDG